MGVNKETTMDSVCDYTVGDKRVAMLHTFGFVGLYLRNKIEQILKIFVLRSHSLFAFLLFAIIIHLGQVTPLLTNHDSSCL
jgi:hypothetical protein